MATNLDTSPQIHFDVGSAVSARVSAFAKLRGQVQTQEEIKFQNAVSSGMSFGNQLEYKKAMLQREEGRPVPDTDYMEALKKDIANLTQQTRFEVIRNDYKDSLQKVVAGRESWEQYRDHLQTVLGNTPDPELQAELRSQLQTAETQVFQHTQDLITNEISLGDKDKSIPLLNKALSDAQNEKAKALGVGDSARASAYDLKISGINQSIQNINIDAKANSLLVNRARKASSVGYLQDINDMVSSADANTPVVYNGVRYDSEQQFWTIQRNKYIETNFFNDLTQEYQKFNKSVADVNGMIPDDVLKNIQSDFTQLSSRPEVQPYLNRLSVVQSSTLKDAITYNANAILDKFYTDGDYKSALQTLDSYKQQYGIDETASLNKVIQKAATDKGQVFQSVLDNISSLVASGMSYSEAANKIFSSVNAGEGKIVAPNPSAKDLVEKTPEQLAASAPEKTKESFNNPAPETANVPTPNQPNEAQQKNLGTQTPGQAGGLTTPPVQTQQPQTTQTPQVTPVDLTGRYGVALLNGNRTVFDKNQSKALSAAQFKEQTGYDINDKNNKYQFDENYKPSKQPNF